MIEKNTKRYYEGNFLDGKENGNGIYVSPDGERYEGNFLNGVKHGIGKLIQ